jgi:nephronectin
MQLRPAPGKGMPICPYGGCQHGKCVEKCLFGKCKKSCVCDPGWEGVSCSLDVNDCRRKVNGKRPCDHRCVNLGGYYRCLCEEGFELEKDERSCKRVKSKCDLKDCEMDCFERYGVAYCSCPKPGLELAPDERSCIDENECETGGVGLCKAREQCVNFYGGYRCDCDEGYARQGQSPICTDIDECALNIHDCQQGTVCHNLPGFYRCIEEFRNERDELVGERDEYISSSASNPVHLRNMLPAHVKSPYHSNFRQEKPAVINYPQKEYLYNEEVTSEEYLYYDNFYQTQ